MGSLRGGLRDRVLYSAFMLWFKSMWAVEFVLFFVVFQIIFEKCKNCHVLHHYGKIGNKICKYFICIKCIWVFWPDATWKFKYTGKVSQSMQTTSGLCTRSLDTTEMVLGKEQKVWRPSLCFDKGGTTVNIVDSCITLLNFSPCIPVNIFYPKKYTELTKVKFSGIFFSCSHLRELTYVSPSSQQSQCLLVLQSLYSFLHFQSSHLSPIPV